MITHENLVATENSLIIVVDLQNKLTSAMPADTAGKVLANTKKLLVAANSLKVPVLVTEQYPKGLGPTEPEIAEILSEAAQVYEKTGFSCCTVEGFTQTLLATKRRQLIVVGQETHVCVLQTALTLTELGYQVHVVEDAVVSRNTAHKTNALLRMQQHGVTVTNHESVLFEWLRDANHPEFKNISRLLR